METNHSQENKAKNKKWLYSILVLASLTLAMISVAVLTSATAAEVAVPTGVQVATDPTENDQDGDGLTDAYDNSPKNPDSDNDYIVDGSDIDPTNDDYDNDTVIDGYDLAIGDIDADDDGLNDGLDPDSSNPDIDGDGAMDGIDDEVDEPGNGNGDGGLIDIIDPILPGNSDPIEPENPDPIEPENPDPIEPENPDPIEPENPDPIEPENPDPIEPENPDPNEPENPDTIEPENPDPILPGDPDTDGDGLIDEIDPDPILSDSDGDGLEDQVDPYPTLFDGDNDGVSDGDEVNLYSTDPTDPDSDDDGLYDGDEGTGIDGTPSIPGTPDGKDDATGEQDANSDGLTDVTGAPFVDKDTNEIPGDGIPDDGLSSPLTPDTDSDGLLDGQDPDPTDTDSDDDGVLDGNDPAPMDPAIPSAVTDADGDGLADEVDPDPANKDYDGDYVLDGEDLNPVDKDNDNDYAKDGVEFGDSSTIDPTYVDPAYWVHFDDTCPVRPDMADSNSDQHGLVDGKEIEANTNPVGTIDTFDADVESPAVVAADGNIYLNTGAQVVDFTSSATELPGSEVDDWVSDNAYYEIVTTPSNVPDGLDDATGEPDANGDGLTDTSLTPFADGTSIDPDTGELTISADEVGDADGKITIRATSKEFAAPDTDPLTPPADGVLYEDINIYFILPEVDLFVEDMQLDPNAEYAELDVDSIESITLDADVTVEGIPADLISQEIDWTFYDAYGIELTTEPQGVNVEVVQNDTTDNPTSDPLNNSLIKITINDTDLDGTTEVGEEVLLPQGGSKIDVKAGSATYGSDTTMLWDAMEVQFGVVLESNGTYTDANGNEWIEVKEDESTENALLVSKDVVGVAAYALNTTQANAESYTGSNLEAAMNAFYDGTFNDNPDTYNSTNPGIGSGLQAATLPVELATGEAYTYPTDSYGDTIYWLLDEATGGESQVIDTALIETDNGTPTDTSDDVETDPAAPAHGIDKTSTTAFPLSATEIFGKWTASGYEEDVNKTAKYDSTVTNVTGTYAPYWTSSIAAGNPEYFKGQIVEVGSNGQVLTDTSALSTSGIRPAVWVNTVDDGTNSAANVGSVEITLPTVDEVVEGESIDLEATVKDTAGVEIVDSGVNWSITSTPTSADTKIDDYGTLFVGVDETATTIDVIATSVVNPAISSAPVTITLIPDAETTKVTVTPSAPEVVEGTTAQFTAEVKEDGVVLPTTLTWTTDSTVSTIDSTGLLTVAAAETLDVITVTATTVDNAATTTVEELVSGTATIVVIPDAATTSVVVTAPTEVVEGSTTPLTAEINDDGVLTPVSFEEATTTGYGGITWAFDASTVPTSTSTTLSTTGSLTIGADEELESVLVKATTTDNPATTTVEPAVTSAPFTILLTPDAPTFTLKQAATEVEEGKTVQFTAAIEDDSLALSGYTFDWTTDSTNSGTTIDSTGLLTVAATEILDVITVTATLEDNPATAAVEPAVSKTATIVVTPDAAGTTVVVTAPTEVVEGSTTPLTAQINDDGVLTPVSFEEATTTSVYGGVTWAFDASTVPTSTSTTLSTTGSLTIGTDEKLESVIVTATTTDNPATTTVEPSVTSAPFTILLTPDAATMTLTQAAPEVEEGKTVQFTAAIEDDALALSDYTFDWTTDSTNSGTTIDSTGLLTVAATETLDLITVTATLEDNPATAAEEPAATKTATIVVTPDAAGTTVTVTAPTEVVEGSTTQLTAEINDDGVVASAEFGSLVWAIDAVTVPTSTSTSISTTGSLVIGADEQLEAITITASTADNPATTIVEPAVTSAPVTITLTNDDATTGVAITAAPTSIPAGTTSVLVASYTDDGVVETVPFDWIVTGATDTVGTYVDDATGTLYVSAPEAASTIDVTVTTSDNPATTVVEPSETSAPVTITIQKPTLVDADPTKTDWSTNEMVTATVQINNPVQLPIDSVKFTDGTSAPAVGQVDDPGTGISTITIELGKAQEPLSTGFAMKTINGFTYSGTGVATTADTPIIINITKYGISTAAELQALKDHPERGNASATFVLLNNITWSGDFAPITGFGATFDGQNYTISGYNSSTNGLFADTTSTAVIKNVNISGGTVNSTNDSVGLLVGVNSGSIQNSTSSGTVNGDHYVGGLVGISNSGSSITGSNSAAVVTCVNDGGGLVGNNSGTLTNSHATGNVTGTGQYTLGGLVGANWDGATIDNCYATGSVLGSSDQVGGLVGYSRGATITNSHATGNVSGSARAGGLVGNCASNVTISNCYATGNVNVNGNGNGAHAGGLVGINEYSTITNSYATGNVVCDNWNTGGLVGYNTGTITNAYATGTTSGSICVGGLVGQNYGNINYCYATGNVLDSYDSGGGLVGWVPGGSVKNCYATGDVNGEFYLGGLCGWVEPAASVTNSYAYQYQRINGNLVNTSNSGWATGIETYTNLTNDGWQSGILGTGFSYQAGKYPQVNATTGGVLGGSQPLTPIRSS